MIEQLYEQNYCNSSAAYANGFNDAKSGKDMDTNYARNCPENQAISIAAYQKGFQYGMQNYCNSAAAYANGLNDAKNGKDMDTNYASRCLGGQEILNAAYRKGFQYGIAYAPKQPETQINIFNKTNTSVPKVPKVPKQCLTDNFNKKVCGYHCIKTPFEVRCARRPTHNCVQNRFNDIVCGLNCRIDNFNHIQCDEIEN